jgi:hypothetical protein
VADFELMKSNAIKFNGQTNSIALEAIAIYDFVKDQVEACRSELSTLEEAVKEQMSGKPKKKGKVGSTKKASGSSAGNVVQVDGLDVDLGDYTQEMNMSVSGDDSSDG